MRVRRKNVLDWLVFLQGNHCDYKNLEIDNDNLLALPEDGSITDQLPACEVDEPFFPNPNDIPNGQGLPNADPNELDDENQLPQTAVVPNLLPDQTEIERLQRVLTQATHPVDFNMLSVPSVADDPISEWDSKPVFRMAFPGLFPFGQGDFYEPREEVISLGDWIRHLLKYKDGRFARHSRFRYYAFNHLLRMQSKQHSSYVCKKLNGKNITFQDLEERVREGKADLANHIVRSAELLRGTRPFWAARGRELEAMVLNLNAPHLFITASAADLQWFDLHAQMPGFERHSERTEHEQYRAASDNLTHNPHIAAKYLTCRFELFLKHVICKVFKVRDHWYRYEWQARGSGHVHGFLWLDEAPAVHTGTDLDRETLAQWWGDWVTAVNLNSTLLPGKNPASLPITERSNTRLHLTECLNRYQRHKCSDGYCLRKIKDVEEKRCRFHFPQAFRTVATVSRDQNPKYYKYLAVRNDTMMNAHIPVFTLSWNANTDMSPCTSIRGVIYYAAKYASKAELKSEPYKELFANAIKGWEHKKLPFLSVAMRVMNQLIGERDWSAQEVAHHLLGLQLVNCTRDFATVDFRPLDEQDTLAEPENGQFRKKGQSWLEKYMMRSSYTLCSEDRLEDVTLFEFVRSWDVSNNRVRRRSRAPARVLHMFPMYKSTPNGPGFEDYCRVKMMLHHPFSEPSELRMPNEVGEQTYIAAYRLCQLEHHGQHNTDPLDIKAEEEAEPDEDFTPTQYESEPEEEHGPQDPFVELAARHGGGGADSYSQNNARDLGNRPEDLAYDWHLSDYLFEQFGEQLDFLTLAKLVPQCIKRTRNDVDTLTEAQRVVFNQVYNHCQDRFSGRTPVQLLMHIDGPAGTGKSYLIDMISTYLFDMAEQHGQLDPVLRAAPTGVAAFGIQGQTLHRLLRLPVRKPFESLSNSVLLSLQQLFQQCHYLIVDEKSMIGLPELYQIDVRLKQIFPNHSDEPFRGMNVLLCGDFYQLPPVGASPLYDTRPAVKIELTAAKELYQWFDETVQLAQIMRQQGEDNSSIQFRTLLQGLRLGEMTDENCQFLQQRVEDRLPSSVRTAFENSLRIYPTRAAVSTYNFAALQKCGHPVLRIQAKHQPSAAKNSSEEDAQGLFPELLLSKDCRLMITCNLLTAFGLVNGTLGTLHDMVWRSEDDPLTSLPCVLWFIPDNYAENGPCERTPEGQPMIPIIPVRREWEVNSVTYSREMFPVVLAYAITVHKSQGLTLDKVVLDISTKDHSLGLTYVAISRVRTIQGLMFEKPFHISRFTQAPSAIRDMREEDHQKRAHQCIN